MKCVCGHQFEEHRDQGDGLPRSSCTVPTCGCGWFATRDPSVLEAGARKAGK